MRLKHFTKPQFLKQIGRPLLQRFFAHFKELEAARRLPSPDVNNEDYFKAIIQLALSNEGLPDEVNNTMYEIETLACPEGRERLEQTMERCRVKLQFQETSTHADIALQVWLAHPEIFRRGCQEFAFGKVSSFHYYGAAADVSARPPFKDPDQARLELMQADLDAWFRQHNRGDQGCRIEVYPLEDEFWFLIHHGDTYARVVTAEPNRTTKVRHFRPAKDDVIVYSPAANEIRIHARTKGERDLYREVIGRRFFGDDRYFDVHKTYTLKPIQEDKADSLRVEPGQGISKIVLRELEWACGGPHDQVVIAKATDLFAAWEQSRSACRPGSTAKLVRAMVEVSFQGAEKRPRKVHIRPPNTLKISRHCDARLVHAWLTRNGFRETSPAKKG